MDIASFHSILYHGFVDRMDNFGLQNMVVEVDCDIRQTSFRCASLRGKSAGLMGRRIAAIQGGSKTSSECAMNCKVAAYILLASTLSVSCAWKTVFECDTSSEALSPGLGWSWMVA